MSVHGIFYFVPMQFICFNGDYVHKDQPVLPVSNRSFKYGDGVFETMKLINGKLVLENFHMQRLYYSLSLLHIDATQIPESYLLDKLYGLCQKNNCLDLARVRLACYRNEDGTAGFVIETHPLDPAVNQWNEKGWRIDIHPQVLKSIDVFANLKSANYLPYVMADIYRKKHQLDECIILNTHRHLCDGSKTNLFIIYQDEIMTPALNEGCVNGTVRRYLLNKMKENHLHVVETIVTEAMLLEADEIFLTNAIEGLRWVQSYKEKEYANSYSRQLYADLFQPIYQ